MLGWEVCMKKIKIDMTVRIMIAVVLGVGFGVAFGDTASSTKFIGDIFLRLIQMSIPLLVFGQIIEAVARLNPKELKGFGTKTLVVFVLSSMLAAAFGVLMALIFKPGSGVNIAGFGQGTVIDAQNISIKDTLLGFFPSNIIDSLAKGSIIQIILFAIFFGIALSQYMINRSSSKVLDVLTEFNEVIIKLITIVMNVAPIGIFILVASTIGTLGVSVIVPLLKYLAVYGLATLLYLGLWISIVSVYCKFKPRRLISNMIEMSTMALATTSSAITLPIALEDSNHKLGIGPRITKLVLPLGMSLNSNGSAMHMAITVMTIAGIYGHMYSFSGLLYIIVIATLASLANAVVPGAGLVSLAIIVPQLGLPLESIAIFAGVEWFVGMLRTILNVTSDVFTALIVAKGENEIDYDIFYGRSEMKSTLTNKEEAEALEK
jgi:Na+/H+-dicarboxylate symporter